MNRMMTRDIKDFAGAVLSRVRERMFGMDQVTRACLAALYTGGHVLLEGNPGLGKTELVKTLSGALLFPSGRIQFTPDLMPADITGTYAPDPESDRAHALVFRPGPVFTCLLLADEINRATPKTQAAMLEAMAERQVTVLGKRYRLQSPFMVLATQNPIDHEGTYTLPEAQSDRFMFKLHVPTPGAESLRRILHKTAGTLANPLTPTDSSPGNMLPADAKASKEIFQRFQTRIAAVEPLALVEAHVLNIFLATNRDFDALEGLDSGQTSRLKDLVDGSLDFGLSPRAARDLMLGAKAWSLMFQPEAEHAEGPGLANVVVPVLRHRMRMRFDWEEGYLRGRKTLDGLSPIALVDRFIAELVLAAAPKAHEYHRSFETTLTHAIEAGA